MKSIIINPHYDIKTDVQYQAFATRFANEQINELVTAFNREVHNSGIVSIRAFYDKALIDEFICRGIDTSSVYDGRTINFDHHVSYDSQAHRLVTID